MPLSQGTSGEGLRLEMVLPGAPRTAEGNDSENVPGTFSYSRRTCPAPKHESFCFPLSLRAISGLSEGLRPLNPCPPEIPRFLSNALTFRAKRAIIA